MAATKGGGRASNTDRGRASRLRAKRRRDGKLSLDEHRWLQRYARERREYARLRATKSLRRKRASRRARPSSARADAKRIAKALARWVGGVPFDLYSGWIRRSTKLRDGSAESAAYFVKDADLQSYTLFVKDPRIPPRSGRAVSISAELVSSDDESVSFWTGVVAATVDWESAFLDFETRVQELAEQYDAAAMRSVMATVFSPLADVPRKPASGAPRKPRAVRPKSKRKKLTRKDPKTLRKDGRLSR